MGWAVDWDSRTGRFRGYGVPGFCEEPDCTSKIDRGLAYACGDLSDGCGRFFCGKHLRYGVPGYPDEDDWGVEEDRVSGHYCSRCLDGDLEPYPLKPERRKWLRHVLKDETWRQWREENPELAEEYRRQRGKA